MDDLTLGNMLRMARNDALEEAAKKAEAKLKSKGLYIETQAVGDAIRAMKNKDTK